MLFHTRHDFYSLVTKLKKMVTQKFFSKGNCIEGCRLNRITNKHSKNLYNGSINPLKKESNYFSVLYRTLLLRVLAGYAQPATPSHHDYILLRKAITVQLVTDNELFVVNGCYLQSLHNSQLQ